MVGQVGQTFQAETHYCIKCFLFEQNRPIYLKITKTYAVVAFPFPRFQIDVSSTDALLRNFHEQTITETSPCAIGNFRKWLLYKSFMSLSLIVIQTNIKFLNITVTWTNIW